MSRDCKAQVQHQMTPSKPWIGFSPTLTPIVIAVAQAKKHPADMNGNPIHAPSHSMPILKVVANNGPEINSPRHSSTLMMVKRRLAGFPSAIVTNRPRMAGSEPNPKAHTTRLMIRKIEVLARPIPKTPTVRQIRPARASHKSFEAAASPTCFIRAWLIEGRTRVTMEISMMAVIEYKRLVFRKKSTKLTFCFGWIDVLPQPRSIETVWSYTASGLLVHSCQVM